MSVIRDPDTEVIWTTEDGERVTLDQMKAGHLLNAYRMLQRRLATLEQDALAFRSVTDSPVNLIAARCAGESLREVREVQARFRRTLLIMKAEIDRRHLTILL